LPVRLTEAEVIEFGRASARLRDESNNLEDLRKAANDKSKAEIGKIDARIGYLSSCINTGQEQRDVECRWEMEYAQGDARLIRLDTGEVVYTRPIKADEYQQSFSGLLGDAEREL
jgi:hypothetical protein